ncbi:MULTISPECIES: type II secretion system protein [unclassified Pseudomonas]|jgi:general secretion pathway protein I|uniref:type II secretion system protein n=1 Tax=unclassified Pseudomonas TaxID=196821 RepID=UPI000C86C8F6|nr:MULTISPECIES: prepilin-type N-terminal cleavage/methylation domain-containing protein [unclassified Pseudomonas]PMV21443.1 general secretion pathway protein GspI [Pseudomonas sp. FW305-3-2-15-C-TSA2]PMV22123.1 general secretion pathway protein GspI [Pseudomonas sp. DP16D-L5]PMV37227.1 general secretion pathway protein GspI [Pseudomonas sp. FW305-3-2-15-A-LB2]PMV44172.1 general secretion pathway protein GspI [Pseudomonas sp. FW305-3-2-15-C-R2A1]PMV47442.1 general secretion pathway protein Gs
MKRQAGFTLLEMLAALTLMAVCSTVLLVAFGQSARSLSQVAHSDRLTHAALTIFDQEAAGRLSNGVSQGELDGIHWQLTSTRQQSRIVRLDLVLSEGSRQARFSTLKARL